MIAVLNHLNSLCSLPRNQFVDTMRTALITAATEPELPGPMVGKDHLLITSTDSLLLQNLSCLVDPRPIVGNDCLLIATIHWFKAAIYRTCHSLSCLVSGPCCIRRQPSASCRVLWLVWYVAFVANQATTACQINSNSCSQNSQNHACNAQCQDTPKMLNLC